MDSRVLKTIGYIAIFFVILWIFSGCSADNSIKVMEREVYISKTSDQVPVTFQAYRNINSSSSIDKPIIDNALKEIVAKHKLKDLAMNCENIAIDIKNYFQFENLKIGLERKYNADSLWPDDAKCPVLLDRPEV